MIGEAIDRQMLIRCWWFFETSKEVTVSGVA